MIGIRTVAAGWAVAVLCLVPLAWAQDEAAGQKLDDKTFVMKAAMGNLAEVQTGQLALERAGRPEVKRYAQRMVTDHTKAQQKLAQLVGRLPQQLDEKHQQMAAKLAGLRGAEFDRAYMDAMVKDHQKTVKLFQTAAESLQSEELRGYAKESLPILQQHLELAEQINEGAAGATGAQR